jgi:TPR repeat protein
MFEKAAHLGNAAAQFFLGTAVEDVNREESIYWHNQVATQNFEESISALEKLNASSEHF